MPTIPPDKIQEVRDAIDIERVIGRSVQLKKQGRRLTGLCPFHKEKTPSFSVDPTNNLYHCFGCHVGGDAIDFVMRSDGVDFPTAIRQLAAEFGVTIPEREETVQEKRLRTKRERLLRVNELTCEFFESTLKSTKSAHDYLSERGLSDETIRKFHLGFAPEGWQNLADELENRRVPVQYPLELGLLGRRSGGRGVYDRLRGRIVFPISMKTGEVLGFGARRSDWLVKEGEEAGPKYLNSPESPIYDKSSIFYGLDLAKDTIRRSRRAILVEGYMDVIALHQAGIEAAVACCGTALSKRHAEKLARMASVVVTMYDGDTAGIDATRRAAEPLLAAGVEVRVLELPKGEDPDTLVQREGSEALQARLKSAPSAIDHFVSRAKATYAGEGLAGLVKTVEEIRPLLLAVKDPLAKDLYIDGAAKRLEVEAAVLRQHLRRARAPQRRHDSPPHPASEGPDAGPPRRPSPPIPVRELAVLRHLVENPTETLRILEEMRARDVFTHDAVRTLIAAAREAIEKGHGFDGPQALEALENSEHSNPDRLRELRETLMMDLPEVYELNECLKRLVRNDIESRLRELRRRIQRAQETDPEAVEQLNNELAALVIQKGSLG